jgi:glyoxylase-like metal-dependent hydrolase (beta-lactamase superfamily II)
MDEKRTPRGAGSWLGHDAVEQGRNIGMSVGPSGFRYSDSFVPGLPAPIPHWTGLPKYNFIGGHNDPDQLPAEALAQAAARVLRREGPLLAIYNLSQGPAAVSGGSMQTAFQLGEFTIHRIVEAEHGHRLAADFLPNLTPELLAENRHWLVPRALDTEDRVVLCMHSYVIRTPHHIVLVDTCLGNDKERPDHPHYHRKLDTRWSDSLAAAGLRVEDIDFVLCTHLHIDHVGWNTRLENGRWVPTFPRARYLFSEKELAFWTERSACEPIPWIEDSVLPVVAAGRAERVTSDHALGDHIQLLPTPGHTVDHFAVQVGRGRAEAVITGDLIHSPLQARYPGLHMRLDHDPEQAVATRRRFLEGICEADTLCCFAHFPSPSVGHVKRWGDGFRCEEVV